MIVPRAVDASVIFSEIAWMGTPESANAEWIEFYNTSTETIDMSGWKLYESGGSTLVYTFTKQIPGKTYFVLERVTPSAPDPLPDISDEAGPFGGSGLSNSGEHLVLKNVEGLLVAEINASSGWPAGDNAEKKTMQRSNGTWITATPTPKAPPQIGTIDGTPDTPPSTGGTTTSGGTPQVPLLPPRSTASYIKIQFPEQIFKGQQHMFSFSPFVVGEERSHGHFYWNMGDGTVYQLTKNEKITHTYLDSGAYSVTVSFALTPYSEPVLIETVRISVLDPSISLALEKEGSVLLISYNGEGIIDIGGWKVIIDEGQYEFPLRTRLLGGTVMRIRTSPTFPFTSKSLFSIITTQNIQVATFGDKTQSVTPTTSTPSMRPRLSAVANSALEQEHVSSIQEEADTVYTKENEQKNKSTSFVIFGGLILVLIGIFVFLDRKMGEESQEE